MKSYVFYTPNIQKKKTEYDLTFVSKRIQGRIIKKYASKSKLKQAVEYAFKENAVLVVALLQHLGNTPKQILKVCKEIGFDNIVCCDVYFLDENRISELCYHRHQRNAYSSICSSIGKRGKGTTKNFTNEGRYKGGDTMKQIAMSNPVNQKAVPEIIRLRKLGMTGQSIADELNKNNYKTPKGKKWSSSSVLRWIGRDV